MNRHINSNVKEMLSYKNHFFKNHLTIIPGLTLLDAQQEIKPYIVSNTFSIIIVVQGNAFVTYKNKSIIYHENEYYITPPQTLKIFNYINTDNKNPFFAFSLRISRHVLSLLHEEYSHMCFPHSAQKNDAYEEDIKIDLFNCFNRLILLMNKPEQINIRAPIIICEIHYLLLISRKWRDYELSTFNTLC